MAQAKSSRQAMPWEADPIIQPNSQDAPWENDPIVEPSKPALSSTDIDPNMEAPAMVRAQVGALDKPEDRLAALRKTYPDAQPYDGDNFIMTDPETGKTIVYNQEGWLPSGGDMASILPEIGEGVGGILGGIGGFVGGGAAGSAVPVIGTGFGAGAGAITGAGAGATAGREVVQRGLNWAFGNEDTRTTGEQLGDAAQTFALSAVGQGLGMGAGALLAKGAKAVGPGAARVVTGKADDVASAAQRAADMKAIGVEPTAGMINGQPTTAIKEQALAATRAGKPIEDRIAQAFDAMDGEANRIVSGLTPQTMTRQELGEALKEQANVLKQQTKARSDALYQRVDDLIGSRTAQGGQTRAYLEALEKQKKAMGQSALLNDGPALDTVIKQAKAVSEDLKKGINFNQLKEARTAIGRIANDPQVDGVLKDRAQGLYGALTADMGETAANAGNEALVAWRKANNYFRRMNDAKGVFGTKSSIDPIIRAQTPEQAADWVLGQVNKGGTRLNAVRRQIERTEGGADLWNTLTGSTIERMGITRGVDGVEAFNPTQMLKQWTKLSPEAKDAMFKGTARKQYRADLDRLARIADNMKDYRRLDNHSGTQKAASALGEFDPFSRDNLLGAVIGGVSGGGIGAVAGGVGRAGSAFALNRWQAKLLTDPKTVAWLADIPAAQMQKGGLKAHLAKLAQMGRTTADPALRVAINDYLREVKYDE